VGEAVEGVGGVFFRARDPDALRAWYAAHLGIDMEEYGTTFTSKDGDQTVEIADAEVWAPFPNAMLAQLRAAGVQVDDRVEKMEFGRFAWASDLEGNRFELWEPS
jgi:predicted enzyme related to lactoylglutathione lyase